MYRLCLAATVALVLFAGFRPLPKTETTIDDVGCIPGYIMGEAYNWQDVYRIIIWDENGVTYLEEIPCGSNNWYERHNVHANPPTGLTNPGVFTSEGTVEFTASPNRAGIITPGTGPDDRDFVPDPSSGKLIISPPVVVSLLQSLN